MNDEQVKEQIINVHDNRSEDELRNLAADYIESRIFTSLQIRDGDADMLQVIFIPLMFIKDCNAWLSNAAFVYEHMEHAGPRAVNGYPSFFSVKKLSKHDYAAFARYVDDYKAMKDKFFSAPPPAQI
jgi:hypothetical protein